MPMQNIRHIIYAIHKKTSSWDWLVKRHFSMNYFADVELRFNAGRASVLYFNEQGFLQSNVPSAPRASPRQ